MISAIPVTVQAFLRRSDCVGAVDNAVIAAAELQCGVTFPPDYWEFLAKFGAAVCAGFEVAGLPPLSPGDEPPFWSDIRTLMAKKSAGLARDLIPIATDGGDYRFYIASGRVGGPVVVYGPGRDGSDAAPSFVAFLESAQCRGIASLV